MDALRGYHSESESESEGQSVQSVLPTGSSDASPEQGSGGSGQRNSRAKRPRAIEGEDGANDDEAAGPRPPSPVRPRLELPDPATLLRDAAGPSMASASADGAQERMQQLQQVQEQQQQRVRSFPHVDGNFATVVYVPVPSSSQLQAACSQALGAMARHVPGLQLTLPGTSSSGQQQQQQQPAKQEIGHHISLSRVVPIRAVQKESLLAALTKQLKRYSSFSLCLRGLRCFANDDATRTFLALMVDEGAPDVCRLVEMTNKAFVKHGLQTFYEPMEPHMSFAWALGDERATVDAALRGGASQLLGSLPPITMPVTQVVCQIGQVKHIVWGKA